MISNGRNASGKLLGITSGNVSLARVAFAVLAAALLSGLPACGGGGGSSSPAASGDPSAGGPAAAGAGGAGGTSAGGSVVGTGPATGATDTSGAGSPGAGSPNPAGATVSGLGLTPMYHLSMQLVYVPAAGDPPLSPLQPVPLAVGFYEFGKPYTIAQNPGSRSPYGRVLPPANPDTDMTGLPHTASNGIPMALGPCDRSNPSYDGYYRVDYFVGWSGLCTGTGDCTIDVANTGGWTTSDRVDLAVQANYVVKRFQCGTTPDPLYSSSLPGTIGSGPIQSGTYNGTFSGTSGGSVSINVAVDGAITGTGDVAGQSFTFSGMASNGSFAAYSPQLQISLSGSIASSASGAISGVWANADGSEKGSFTAARR